MPKLTKPAALLLFALLFSSFPVVATALNGINSKGMFISLPAPWLLEPVTDKIDITGKDALEFKWKPDLSVNTDYYDFRLYKGYDMLASTLILKQKLEGNVSSFKVKAETFENGQVYTWSLRRVILSGEKSDKSFSSFKIVPLKAPAA
jgi:hypothetical protein